MLERADISCASQVSHMVTEMSPSHYSYEQSEHPTAESQQGRKSAGVKAAEPDAWITNIRSMSPAHSTPQRNQSRQMTSIVQ